MSVQCRVQFYNELQGDWVARGVDSTTEFTDIDLSQQVNIDLSRDSHNHYCLSQEWSDYDEKAQQPVSILEISHRFIKVR